MRDAGAPKRVLITPETEILIRRNSPHDFQDRQIYVWIDDEALGKIRYGDAISRPIEPGRHTVRVFNTLVSRTLTVDAAPGEQRLVIAPFQVDHDGLSFGLIPDHQKETLTLEPGSMITFMEPWDGEYYT